jgi:hypothetical protein
MLNEKNLLNYFWAKAVAIAIYIMNRTFIAVVHGITPKEKFRSNKPNVSHFRIFGCIAYVQVLEVYLHWIFLRTKRIKILHPFHSKVASE